MVLTKKERKILRQRMIKGLLRSNADIYEDEITERLPMDNGEMEAISSWFVDGVDSEMIKAMPLDRIEAIYDAFGMKLEEYHSVWEDNQERHRGVEGRVENIREMYDYEATDEDITMVPETLEVIDNWYVVGFSSVEKLEKMFDIEDVYDMKLDYKVFIKDLYEECRRLV